MPGTRQNKKVAASSSPAPKPASAKAKPAPSAKPKAVPAAAKGRLPVAATKVKSTPVVAKTKPSSTLKTRPAPEKKAVVPVVAKSKKRTVAEAQQDSDDEFGQVAIDMASDEEEDAEGDTDSDDEDVIEEFPEEDGQDMSAADIEDDDEDNDSEGSYMEGDSIVDSQEESDDGDDEDDEDSSDFGDLKEDDIDPNFGHNLNEPLPEESEYNPIRREYPEIDPVYDSDSSTEEVHNPLTLYISYLHFDPRSGVQLIRTASCSLDRSRTRTRILWVTSPCTGMTSIHISVTTSMARRS